MLHLKRKGTFNIVIGFIILIVLIGIVILLIKNAGDNYNTQTSCESTGGSCITQSLDCDQTSPFKCGEGKICCLNEV